MWFRKMQEVKEEIDEMMREMKQEITDIPARRITNMNTITLTVSNCNIVYIIIL